MKSERYQSHFIGAILVVFLFPWILEVYGEKDILLYKNQNLTSWYWLTRFEFGPWSGWSRDSRSGGYTVCDLSETGTNHTNSWLVSEYVDLQDANEAIIELEFTARQCPSGLPFCKQSFDVYVLQTNGAFVNGITKAHVQSGNFSLVSSVNATSLWTPGNSQQVNRVNMTFAVSRGGGIYIAFQDRGACIALMSVKLSYAYCPNVVNHGAVFKKTPVPSISQHNITVNGNCSDGASVHLSNSTLALTCLSSGQWEADDTVTCLCTAGYELVGDTCTGCNAGYYKDSVGNGQCIICPSNSESSPSRDLCPCKNGFYRAPQDTSNDSCTAPPSEPRDINITVVMDSVVMVAWSRPAFDGGRADVKYDLRCSACSNMGSSSGGCLGAQFWPSEKDLTSPQVTISNLDSEMLYNITVISKNGVSNQAGQSSLRYLHKTFSLRKVVTSTPQSATASPTTTVTITSGNLTTTEGTIIPEKETSSPEVWVAIGISVAVTFVICFLVAAIIIYLLNKFWRKKQSEQHSAQSSVTQLSEMSLYGAQLKRMRSVTATTELSEFGTDIELQDKKLSITSDTTDANFNSRANSSADLPPLKSGRKLPPINVEEANSDSRPNSVESNDSFLLNRKDILPAISILEAKSNLRPDSPGSPKMQPSKKFIRLPNLNWTPPRAISPVLLPSESKRIPHSPTFSPRKPPEGSELERNPSTNSWFPAENVQYNI